MPVCVICYVLLGCVFPCVNMLKDLTSLHSDYIPCTHDGISNFQRLDVCLFRPCEFTSLYVIASGNSTTVIEWHVCSKSMFLVASDCVLTEITITIECRVTDD